jgi:nucleoside-diphosphate-sugar epimerase
MQRTCFVIGAGGFIGSHVVRRLHDAGWHVLAGTRQSRQIENVQTLIIEGVDEAALEHAVGDRPLNAIINLAAYGVDYTQRDPAAMQHTNVDLAAAIIRFAARHGAAVIMAGSCAEYARPLDDGPLDEHAPLETGKLYGSSKAAGGLLAMATAKALNVPMRLLRLFNVYGPGEAAHRLFPSLYVAKGTSARVTLSEGSQIRDFIYVEDVAEVMTCALDGLCAGQISSVSALNVSTGTGTTVRHFAQTAARLIGLAPAQLGFGDNAIRMDEIPFLVGNAHKLQAELNWKPVHDVQSGLVATLSAYRTL